MKCWRWKDKDCTASRKETVERYNLCAECALVVA